MQIIQKLKLHSNYIQQNQNRHQIIKIVESNAASLIEN